MHTDLDSIFFVLKVSGFSSVIFHFFNSGLPSLLFGYDFTVYITDDIRAIIFEYFKDVKNQFSSYSAGCFGVLVVILPPLPSIKSDSLLPGIILVKPRNASVVRK
ncbi:hypothetical protein EHS13_09380 [Paenibacillus psychroresistens]|uniref:Uncharacterized protein n=1 Tax=Paenibacillus psychroresistens TaxID=1778678 RepID=A0A6B8RG42_9BACL|nr:hypothetical protein [Paenibacillus psychroresistens]QGQ95079.1 hypothetical protein EHS13_09380 [Paenibacillus psychroresistens]